jgi:hypothetical protein
MRCLGEGFDELQGAKIFFGDDFSASNRIAQPHRPIAQRSSLLRAK